MAIDRERLRALLGLEEVGLLLRSVRAEERNGYRLERLTFETCGGEMVRGLLTRPIELFSRAPAIVYAHAHGGRYDIGAAELIDGRPELMGPLASIFAHAGFVTLAIDMPTFGERATVTESAAAKAALWRGKSLFGRMLSEQAAAITYLASRSDVLTSRIGMFGMSMGATLSYWLAAADPRLAAIAHLCCFADFATLIETGAHDLHGIYLTVPGLLAATSSGEMAGLVAPRPQLVCIGEDDPLTPRLAVDRGLVHLRAGYEEAGAARELRIFRQRGVGHMETPEMRDEVVHFLVRHLRG